MKTLLGPASVAVLAVVLSVHGAAQAGGSDPCATVEHAGSNLQGDAAVGEILDMLGRMNAGLQSRDVDALVRLFVAGPRVVVIGSKKGKVAHGTREVREMFEDIVSGTASTRFDWRTCSVDVAGDVAWLFAMADLVHERAEAVTRVPYRVTSLFMREGGTWKWMQYHGSEPIGD